MPMVLNILRAVDDTIRKHGLLPPQELVEALGGVVLFVPMPYGKIRGVSYLAEAGDKPLVVIDAGQPELVQKGGMVHEGAHLVLHRPINRIFLQRVTLFPPGRFEIEADVYGIIYLVKWDEPGFEECGRDLYRFADWYGLSRQAAEMVIWSCGSLRL